MWNWWKEHRRREISIQLVSRLLAAAHEAGLPAHDCRIAHDMLSAGEQGLAFDIVVTQLYEHEVEIPDRLLAIAQQAAESMLLTPGSYFFLGELIRSADHVPVPVREKLAHLIDSLRYAR